MRVFSGIYTSAIRTAKSRLNKSITKPIIGGARGPFVGVSEFRQHVA